MFRIGGNTLVVQFYRTLCDDQTAEITNIKQKFRKIKKIKRMERIENDKLFRKSKLKEKLKL